MPKYVNVLLLLNSAMEQQDIDIALHRSAIGHSRLSHGSLP